MYLFIIAILASFVVEQCSLCRKVGWQRFTCWSFICFSTFSCAFFRPLFQALAEFAFVAFVVVVHWFLFVFFSLSQFLFVISAIYNYLNGTVRWMTKRKSEREQLSTVGQIEKVVRAIKKLNPSQSRRQRAHINRTPGDMWLSSRHTDDITLKAIKGHVFIQFIWNCGILHFTRF